MEEYYDLTFFSGPSHGWLRVPYALLYELGVEESISNCSYIDRARQVFLEQDSDASKFNEAMRNYPDVVVRVYTTVLNSEDNIRRLQAYAPIPLLTFSVSLSLNITTHATCEHDLWEAYEKDPVAWVESLVDGDWSLGSLNIEED